MAIRFKKLASLLIIATLIIITATSISHAATYTEMDTTLTDHFTTNNSSEDYITIDIDDNNGSITLNGKTLLNRNYFAVSIKCYEIDDSGNEADVDYAYSCYYMNSESISNGSFNKTIDFDDINTDPSSSLQEPYKYYLIVNILENASSERVRSNAVITGLEIVFDENGNPKFPVYDKCSNRNDSIIGEASASGISPNAFLDRTLSTESSYANGDYVLTTSTQVNAIKNLSDSLTEGCNDDYSKALNIYTWITEYMYYDFDASTNGNAEVNPYKLYRQFINSGGNSDGTCDSYYSNGDPKAKMWSYCNGYATMFTALARAQDIPVRFVSGCAISPPYDVWEDESFSKVDHYWVEAYINGEWIIIDPTRGTSNLFKSGSYTYSGTARYSFFDMTEESLASTHCYIEYSKGNYSMAYLSNTNDIANMDAYLSGKNSSGYVRGSLINSNYSSSDKSTWGNGGNYNAKITPLGELKRIEWSGVGIDTKYKLGGNLDFSDATGLQYFSASSQNITSLNFDGCDSLISVYCTWNKLASLDLSDSENLNFFNCSNNLIKKIKYQNPEGRTITFTAWSGGYVEGVYDDGKITVTSKPLPGYYALGLYSASGNRITSKSSYTFTPQGTTYTTRYGVTTSGYPGYPLRSGKNDGTVRQNCNTAIETRLKSLGYFKLTPNGYYTSTTASAVKAFQYANGISATGEVNKTTWKKLFSTSAKSIYKSSYYSYLKKGSSSSRVYLVEFRLKQLGYFTYTPNTYYGTGTQNAIKEFQSRNGMSATGSIGSTTWSKLFSSSATKYSDPSFVKTRSYKSSGTDVALAELRLKELGYFQYTPNSYYGTGTRDSVKAFQIVNNLPITGSIDKATWISLFSTTAKDFFDAEFNQTMVYKNSSNEVYLLELRLKQLGYFKYTPNNYFGTATRDAVNAFKANYGYYYDGRATSTVWNKVFTENAKSIYSTPYSYLKKGSYSRKVVIAELRLKNLGYFKYTPDRYFKSSTRDAVKAFQKDHGLTQTGTLNSATWNKLF